MKGLTLKNWKDWLKKWEWLTQNLRKTDPKTAESTDSKNEKEWLGKKIKDWSKKMGRSVSKSEKDWTEKWDWFIKWEGLTRKMGKSDSRHGSSESKHESLSRNKEVAMTTDSRHIKNV